MAFSLRIYCPICLTNLQSRSLQKNAQDARCRKDAGRLAASFAEEFIYQRRKSRAGLRTTKAISPPVHCTKAAAILSQNTSNTPQATGPDTWDINTLRLAQMRIHSKKSAVTEQYFSFMVRIYIRKSFKYFSQGIYCTLAVCYT